MHNTVTFNILSCESGHLGDTACIFREIRKRGKGRRINYVKMRVNSVIIQRINAIDETEIDPVKVLNCGNKFYILIFGIYQHLLRRTWRNSTKPAATKKTDDAILDDCCYKPKRFWKARKIVYVKVFGNITLCKRKG